MIQTEARRLRDEGMERGMEQGIGQEKINSALRMIEAGKLPLEEIAVYSGLTLAKVRELEKELQPI
jgi:hypothetical protein